MFLFVIVSMLISGVVGYDVADKKCDTFNIDNCYEVYQVLEKGE